MKTFALVLAAAGMLAQPNPEVKKPAEEVPKPALKKPETAAPVKAGPKSESLHFNINWPSGLSLGEATMSSSPGESGLNFSFNMEASIPGFVLAESVNSRATGEYCSIELTKKGTRGKRKLDEKTQFDAAARKATRTTEGGGKSEVSTPSCAKDALTFIYFLRRELAAGRLPQQQNVYYGGAYPVRVTFVGSQAISIGGESIEADKLQATIKGSGTEVTADLFFAKDSTRTPLLVQAPLVVGKFSMELVR